MEKIKVCWRNEEGTSVGNALGYSTHTKFMKKYGEKYFDYDENAKIALAITPADHYKPVPGKFNVLFSMWEFLDLPMDYIKGINEADAVVVPSRFCKDLFSRYTDNPVDVCWEGIEAENYIYHERRKSLPFRFLWLGAPNPRKGYPLILEAIKVFENIPEVEIYIKTTVQDMNWTETVRNAWRKRKLIFRKDTQERKSFLRRLRSIPRPGLTDKFKRLGRHKNIIWDTRHLSFEDLIGLYNSAHCFLLPTFGEGWGLTLCEALATGCPSIATNVTGVKDYYTDDIGYTLRHEVKEQTLEYYDLVTRGYVPDTRDLIDKMLYVIAHYNEALRKGKKASERIRNKFTWEQSAKRLYEIIGGYNVN